MPIRTLLADDHQLFRQGMAELLMREEGFDLVGQTGDGLACVEMARELRPNVVITDLTMPSLNGIDVTRRVLSALPDTKVVCVSIHDESHMVCAAIEAGAAGYVLKSCAFDELARCVRAVATNQVYLCPAIASIVVTQCRQGTTRPRRAPRSRRASARSPNCWPRASRPSRSPTSSRSASRPSARIAST
jgi:DNA-binding NarL/FixJ family response regulator